jgi:hypothetical protein
MPGKEVAPSELGVADLKTNDISKRKNVVFVVEPTLHLCSLSWVSMWLVVNVEVVVEGDEEVIAYVISSGGSDGWSL